MASNETEPGKPFLTSRTGEWLMATLLGLALVKTATLSGAATVVGALPWAKDFGGLLTFFAPELDRNASLISGVALFLCGLFISSAANPRSAFGWWTMDIFVFTAAQYLLGSGIASLVAFSAGAIGLLAARQRGEYWPRLMVEHFFAWYFSGGMSFVAILLLATPTKL